MEVQQALRRRVIVDKDGSIEGVGELTLSICLSSVVYKEYHEWVGLFLEISHSRSEMEREYILGDRDYVGRTLGMH